MENTKRIVPPIINGLLSPKAYSHNPKKVQLVETHISWVLLTGKYAYKLKKPLDLGFIKATSLSERIHLCKEEIRLNQRLAPDLYIGISKVIGPTNKLHVSEENWTGKDINKSNILDVMVKMHQFPSDELLSKKLKNCLISKRLLDELAHELAKFHLTVDKDPKNAEYGNLDSIVEPVLKNLEVLTNIQIKDPFNKIIKTHLEWVGKERYGLAKRFAERLTKGAIRECHGDLHTENIYLKDNLKLEVFDSIEFEPKLRWIDPISEIAFLVMDLMAKDCKPKAIRFLNLWLELTGDYVGTDLLPWYIAYRAMVRSKVLGIRNKQINTSTINSTPKSTPRGKDSIEYYLDLVNDIQSAKSKGLIIMHGLSGSGKSFVSGLLYEQLFGIRICSDIERKRIFNSLPIQDGLSIHNMTIEDNDHIPRFYCNPYDKNVSEWLYQEWLTTLTSSCLKSGFITIVDAAFLKRKERMRILQIADNLGRPFVIVSCNCNDQTAKKRISERLRKGNDHSEADYEIREKQKSWIEPLTQEEKKFEVKITESTAINSAINDIKLLLGDT